jgi:CelD/BcsL family acetyltransferase involved in cellulose biosynthesis
VEVKSFLKRLVKGKLRISQLDDASFEPFIRDGLTSRCWTSFPDDAIVQQWEQLIDRTPLASAFQSSAWHRGLASVFCKANRLRLLTVHRGEQLLGVLPLQLAEGGYLEVQGAALSDYLDPLVADGEQDAFWTAALSHLGELWDWGVSGLVLHNIRGHWPGRAALPALAAANGFAIEESAVDKVVRATLRPTWEEFSETLDGHNRREMLRKVRRAETQGACKLLVESLDQNLDAAIAEALRLSEASGGDRAESIQTYVRPLLAAVGPDLMRRGRLLIKTLFLEAKPAACLLVMPCSDGPLIYNGGFDPAFHWYSPGTVLTALGIQQAIQAKSPYYDMLRGQEQYKYRFGGVEDPIYRLTLKPV